MLISPASKRHCTEDLLVTTLKRDPSLKPTISSYPASQRYRIRKAYISKGSIQPQRSKYPYVKQATLDRQSEQQKADHRLRLIASIETMGFLAHQCLAFRGHDESKESFNHYQCVCLDRASKNATMTSPDIQKDILRAMASCTMIQREVPSAYYVHCFAHRLQLALISAAKNHIKVCRYFVELSLLCVTVVASCKQLQSANIRDAIVGEEMKTGRRLNQEQSLRRWRTHFVSICRVLGLYDSVVKVLETIVEDATVTDSKAEASKLLEEALQRKNQDILNAIDLVAVSKYELQVMRSKEGWKTIYEAVQSFCLAKNIVAPDMESCYVLTGSTRRNADNITCDHYYRVEIFYNIVVSQLNELDDHFLECSSALLTQIAYLYLDHLRIHGNVSKLVELERMYPDDFDQYDLVIIEDCENAVEEQNGRWYLADTISLFVERELAQGITTYVLIEKFQTLSTRRLQLD
ncbi:hypothetical protein MARPO_0003s0141 [Marchantia polymorpha]|uniref:DUF4371 domain-containing protein n=1 Tax=Marchantia polymorpha TaxID=3197 RepID=A0A2R6XT08_MARPO|nr:hypothetical protein MARPO_0003s0141 [Marchantia polymorpha]|eukprot:PTQ49253.1 hypothetical protein MARPO_0003s0141 [Marchantia polymorpha]